MPTANKKQTPRAPATRKRPSKKGAKDDHNAYARSLSEGELVSRLRRRYPEAASTAVEDSNTATLQVNTVKVQESKKAIVARAQEATGISAEDFAITLAVQAAVNLPGGDAKGDPEKGRALVSTAIETLEQIKPEGALQSMLAVQMIGVHNTAIKFLMQATTESQSLDVTDANVNRAVRLMRVFNDQLDALASLRGKTSQQKVTVKHVHVHEGGKAIVGNVTGASRTEEGGQNGN